MYQNDLTNIYFSLPVCLCLLARIEQNSGNGSQAIKFQEEKKEKVQLFVLYIQNSFLVFIFFCFVQLILLKQILNLITTKSDHNLKKNEYNNSKWKKKEDKKT